MDFDFKNILAGVGGMCILMIVAILGIYSNADYSNTDSVNEFTSNALICPLDNYGLYSNYPTPTNSPVKIGTSIYIDSTGRIFSIFTGNNEIENFDENGKNYKVFADKDKYKEQSFDLVGMYIDESRGIVYIPGDRLLSKVYRYDLNGEPLTPAFWDKVYARSISGFGDSLITLASDVTGLKKYDLNGKLLKSKNPIVDKYKSLDIYPDMAVGKDGTIYVPMNVEKGIFDKNPKTGKYDILVGYEYISTILRFDQNLVMLEKNLEDSPFYKRQEKREIVNGVAQKFKEDEKQQTFARINIDSSGNLAVLLKNRTDLDANGFSRSNVFKIYKPDGTLLKEWSAPGYHFYDFDSDPEGNFYAAGEGNIYKFIKKCGEITIEKNVEPDSGDVFTFHKDFLDKSDFSLQDKAKVSFDIWEPFLENTTFNINEEINAKYDTRINCEDASLKTVTDKNIAKIKLNNENSGQMSCLFTNEAQKGKLIIKKIEQPNTFSKFGFYLIDPANYIDGVLDTFSLENEEEKEFDLGDGTYNVREHIVPGYITKISCTVDGQSFLKPFVVKTQLDPNNPNSSLTESEVQVYIKRGIVTTCIFINSKINGFKDSTGTALDSGGER